MSKIKKVLTFVFFSIVAVSGMLFGCSGKYDNVKVTSDREETGLKLYLGEDTDEQSLSTGTVTFTVSGLENGAKNLKFSFEGNEESKVVSIAGKQTKGESVTLTLKAISGGSTKLVALTDAGSKSCSVKIDCVKRLKSFGFIDTYKPAMFNVKGSELVLSSRNISFEPADATENQITYSIEPAVFGARVTSAGVLTLDEQVSQSTITVIAKSVDNPSLTDSVSVKLVNPISTETSDGIDIYTESPLFGEDGIILTTEGEESSIQFRVDVNTIEAIGIEYKVLSSNESVTDNSNVVAVSQNGSEFHVYANDIGECYICLEINFTEYSGMPSVKKMIHVSVLELPSTLSVNGITEDFSDNIYTYYQNGKGQEYVVTVGNARAYDRTFLLAADNPDNLSVRRNDGREIKLATYNGEALQDTYELLQSGQSIFVEGLNPNDETKLYIFAFGSIGHSRQIVRTISLKTLLGSHNVKPIYKAFDGQDNSKYFVEVGQSFELDYEIDSNSSAYGIKLLASDGSEISGNVSIDLTDGQKPTITIHGESIGEISCKLVLENGIESEVFNILVFKQIEYTGEDNELGGVYFKVDSPLQNRNIARANYEVEEGKKTLRSFVMSIGTGVQLEHTVNPQDAAVYSISYESVLINDDLQGAADEYLSISKSGYIIAKKLLEDDGTLAVKVTIESLKTNDGDVVIAKATRIINVEIYTPMTDVIVSKKSTTIYDVNNLNPVQIAARINGDIFQDAIELSLYPNSIRNNFNVEWDCSNAIALSKSSDGLNAKIGTLQGFEYPAGVSIYTVTATVHYYSTTIVRRTIVNVVNPTRASVLTANVDDEDSKTAYFEVENDMVLPASIQINTALYSKFGKQDVTFDDVRFISLDENVAVVSESGLITPVGSGRTQIRVYAEDMMTSLSALGSYQVIEVYVADGASEYTALRIRNERDFKKLAEQSQAQKYYFLNNDITLNDQYDIQSFVGTIDGRNHTINGIVLNNSHTSLFGEIAANARIRDLVVTSSFDFAANADITLATVAKVNNGSIENVVVNFVNANLMIETSNISVRIAGLVDVNNGNLTQSSVSGRIILNAQNETELSNLEIGGLILQNNVLIEGLNNNYEYHSTSFIQPYDFNGSIYVDDEIRAQSSAIGAIAAVNNNQIGTNNNGSVLGEGFAANVSIYAKNIDNVGGIAGVNNGTIKNALVDANIVANSNVGGVAGYFGRYNVDTISQNNYLIENAIVEMYQNALNVDLFGIVQGNENVGGLVGLSNKNAEANKIQNCYVYAYDVRSGVYATSSAGGLVGFANGTNITKCYVNAKVGGGYDAQNNEISSQIAGGLVGVAENVMLQDVYSLAKLTGITFGSAIGSVNHLNNGISTVDKFYSSDAYDIVGAGDVADYAVQNSYTIDSDLKNISTYQNWDITSDNDDLSHNWLLSPAENNGYPALIYNQFVMRKLMPTQILLDIDSQYVYDELIVLNVNSVYSLSRIIAVSTDIANRASIYVYANVDGVLNTKNTTNLLSTRATLQSNAEQIVTLTFVLKNDPSVKKQVQIAFVDLPVSVFVDKINIKLGETAKITALGSYDGINYSSVSPNVMLGIDANASSYPIENSYSINGNFIASLNSYLFNVDAILTSIAGGETNTALNVFYVVKYIDLFGEEKIAYLDVTEQLSSIPTLAVDIYAGANGMNIDGTSFDITLLDTVTFTVILSTDKIDEKLIVTSSSDEISFVQNQDAESYVITQKSDGEKISNADGNSKLILSLIAANFADGKLTATFELAFNPTYLDANSGYKFNKLFTSVLNFYAQSNEDIKGSVEISANPQNLLKIDLTNFPAGRKQGTSYKPQDTPANTLTPGQVGLLTIDIYPEYAYFDELQLVSSVDASGNYISFIQMAKDASKNEVSYVEIKPNTNVIENGILLLPYSNIQFNNNGENVFTFDGRFYVNTLIGSNVERETYLTITVIGITKIIGENGELIETRRIVKELTVQVNPAPELAISQMGDAYKSFVDADSNDVKGEYNLIYVGQTLNFAVELKNGLIASNLRVNSTVITKNSENSGVFTIDWIGSNSFSLKANHAKAKAGDRITIWVSGTKIVNGFAEEYSSNKISYVVVDYILTGIQIAEADSNQLSLLVNEPKLLTAKLTYLSNGSEEVKNKIEQLETQIATNSNYWYDIQKQESWNLKEANSTGSYEDNTKSYSKDYGYYTAYQPENPEGNFTNVGIVGRKEAKDLLAIELRISYGYAYIGSNFEFNMGTSPEITQEQSLSSQVSLSFTLKSNLDEPVAVETVKDFYEMKAGYDYILMNDLYFGYGNEAPSIDGKQVSEDKWAETYTPFELSANSFDGNLHTIHFGGMHFNTDASSVASISLFTSINSGSILDDLNVSYESVPEYDINGNKLRAQCISIDNNSTLSATSINFAGVAITNNGVISNINVYYNGDISIDSKSADGEVNIAGFVYQNSGKITYSSVYGVDFNENFTNENNSDGNYKENIKFVSNSAGNIAGFVVTNNDVIANCQVEFVGIENNASATRNAKVAGFAISNTKAISNSSAVGQRLIKTLSYDIDSTDGQKEEKYILPVRQNDDRIESEYRNLYFARLNSNGNIAGFVYANSGNIENAYTAFPIQTQSRSAGFVFDNSNSGSVLTSYTVCCYDGSTSNSSAHSPFVGTNELGEVLNSSTDSVVQYCYYLTENLEVDEEDKTFKEPASRIGIDFADEDDVSSRIMALTDDAYKGFDLGSSMSGAIWDRSSAEYVLPLLNSNSLNQVIRPGFFRNYTTIDDRLIFGRKSGDNNPIQIADATQFVNTFNDITYLSNDGYNYFKENIRLINDIDLTDYAGTPELNKIRNVIYSGDLDGNGMTISGIKLIGNSAESINNFEDNPYLYTSSSFGLFNQIGTATIKKDNDIIYNSFGFNNSGSVSKAVIRNLILKVDEVSKSTSTFTGILAGLIVNTDIKSLKVDSNGVSVHGRNAVGGVAGAVVGESTLYNVSVNANVTSSYQLYTTNAYRDKKILDVEKYNYTDYSTLDKAKKYNFAGESNFGYAGGIAGIVDIYQDDANSIGVDGDAGTNIYTADYENKSDRIKGITRSTNLHVLTVYGDVSISGEIVGGLFGTTNEDCYIQNATFEVSANNSQRLQAYFAAGALVGVANGTVIRLSKVEVSQAYADAYDSNLTNQTGNSLFNTQTYPFAIGGLIGIERGGYIIQSYSKTNVINARAKYAGGIVGYLTDFDFVYEGSYEVGDVNEIYELKNIKNGRYVLFEEVYTTGNVFAGDEFDIVDSNGVPKSYFGGIAGYYNPSKFDNGQNYDRFNGVIGINAFHIPDNYSLQTAYRVKQNDGSTRAVTYADMLAGYTGTRTKSNGEVEIIEFQARVGSIFGKVEVDESKNCTYTKSDSEYSNLYTNFIYNKNTINASDATNSNGLQINYFASANNYTVSNVDSFDFSGNGSSGKVVLNTAVQAVNNFKPAESYLVLRGTGSYIKYMPNSQGIYGHWDDDWIFQNPVYPKLKPNDPMGYTPIETENDLKRIRSGNRYKIVADIYLTSPWIESLDLNYTTIISSRRTDGMGIKVDGRTSLYYAIYNINMDTDYKSTEVFNYGFFRTIRGSVLKNINFVFGTNFENPISGANYNENGSSYGFNVNSNNTVTNVGLLAGSINHSEDTGISGCNIILNSSNNAKYSISLDSSEGESSAGIVAGVARQSKITSVKVYAGAVNDVDGKKSLTTDDVEFTAAAMNVGGLYGTLANCTIESNRINGVAINGTLKNTLTNNNSISLSAGGVVGKLSNDDDQNTLQVKGNFNLSNINVTINNDTAVSTYIGGFAGFANNAIISAAYSNDKLDVRGQTNGNVYVGGLYGDAHSITDQDISSTSSNSILNASIKTIKCKDLYASAMVAYANNIAQLKDDFNSMNLSLENIECENLYSGSLFGHADSISQIDMNCEESYLTLKNVKAKSVHSGGLFGLVQNLTIQGWALNSSVSLANVKANDKDYGFMYVGGIAGESVNASLSGFDVETLLTIDDKSSAQIAEIGGAFGALEINDSIISQIQIKSLDMLFEATVTNNLYIAGFAGAVTSNSNANGLNKCVVSGDLIYSGNSGSTLLAGFAASGSPNNSSNPTLNKVGISNSIADVNIILTENDERVSVAGFVCECFGKIATCASVGDIIYAGAVDASTKEYELSKSSFLGKVSGFASMGNTEGFDDANQATITNSYSFTTLKMFGNNIKPTSFSSNFGIWFNYNLSGVFDLSESKSQNNKAYSELLASFVTLLSSQNSDFDYSSNGKLQAQSVGDNDYYHFDNTYFANNSNVSVELSDANSILANQNSYVAGFRIKSNVLTNNGYVFNCIVEGSISSSEDFAGFVNTNNALINACGTNAVLDADNKKINVAGFALNNTGVIANSYATNIFKNDAKCESISGFVKSTSGVIYNCYTSLVMFRLDKNFNNVNIFLKNSGGSISDIAFSTDYGITSSYGSKYSYVELKEKSAEMFNIGKENDEWNYNENVNYGLATPFSYANSSYGIGNLNTGNNSDSEPYIINNYSRFDYVVSRVLQSQALNKNVFTMFALDIDARNVGEIDGYTANPNLNLSIKNDSLYALYGVTLKTGSTGMFSGNSITFNNFGFVANLPNSISQSAGALVNSAKTLNATNSYAVVKNAITVDSAGYFGVFAGKVTNRVTMNNCFAGGEITINAENANVGMLFGETNTGSLKDSFAYGIISINKACVVGGFVGNNKANVSECSAYVVMKNQIKDEKYSCSTIGAVFGVNSSTNAACFYTSIVSLIGDNLSSYFGVELVGNFANNDIIKTEIAYDGSLLKPIEFTNNINVQNDLYYCVGNVDDESLERQLTKQITTSPKMIIGNDYTLNASDTIKSLFYTDDTVSTIISNMTLKKMALNNRMLGRFSGYAYKLTFVGSSTNNYAVYAIADNAVFDTCESSVHSTFSVSNASAFVGSSINSIFRNITVSAELSRDQSKSVENISGLFNSVNYGAYTYIQGSLEISLKVTVNNTLSSDCYVGGIIPIYSSNDGNIVFHTSSNPNIALELGGARVKFNAGCFAGNIQKSIAIDVPFNCTITTSSKSDGVYGGVAGKLSHDATISKAIVSSFQYNSTESQNNVTECIGGIVGETLAGTSVGSSSTTMTDVQLNSFDATTNVTNANIGGIVGKNASYIKATVDLTGEDSEFNCEVSGSNGIINIGGVAGEHSRNNMFGEVKGKELIIKVNASCQTNVGGVAGTLKESSNIGYTINRKNALRGPVDPDLPDDDITQPNDSTLKVSSDINVAVTSMTSGTTYVGGIAGIADTTGIVNVENKGLVAAYTKQKKAYHESKSDLPNARTYSGAHNYQSKSVHIPLAVGGVFGLYQNVNAKSGLFKTSGDVRGLIVGNVGNEETAQARVGGICGLCKNNVERLDDKSGFSNAKMVDGIIGHFGAWNDNRSQDISFNMGNEYQYGQYKLENIAPTNYYYDFGNTDKFVWGNEDTKDKTDMKNITETGFPDWGTREVHNFNYDIQWDGYKDTNNKNKTHSVTNYSQTNFTENNIFETSTNDYYLSTTDRNYKIVIPYGGDGHVLVNIRQNNDALKSLKQNVPDDAVGLFAGYSYQNDAGVNGQPRYACYNRSFWYVAKLKGDGGTSNLLFYPTQHWAGEQIGGVLAS